MNTGFPIRMLNGVGVVATSKRSIKPGNEFNSYFPKPQFSDPLFTPNGENEMTIDRYIPEIVARYNSDTANIANVLKQSSLEATLKALFEFIYKHIQYKLDAPHEEQIRRPARTWFDRKTGVDCDCYTVFISSILTNLNIPHYLRMAAYNPSRGYQHIYVVVPKIVNSNVSDRNQYYTVDPVMDAFNAEKPFLNKKDKAMSFALSKGLNGFPIRMLNGDFSSRQPVVYKDIYFHPGLDTWSLKGVDGGYYLEGDYNRRFIEPLHGLGFLPAIMTGIKVGAGLFKGAKKLFGRKKKKKNAAPVAETALKATVQSAAPALVSSQGTEKIDFKDIISGENKELKDLLNSKIVASNKATVMSLKAVDTGLKDQINKFTGAFGGEVKKMVADGANLKDLTAQLKSLSIKALETTNLVKKDQANIEGQTVQINEALKTEQFKAEQFRTEQRNQSKIMMISLVALGVVLVYVAVKKSN
jgi:hypothetical protein